MKNYSSQLADFGSVRHNGLPLTIGILQQQNAKRVRPVERTADEHATILEALANRVANGLPLFEDEPE